MMRDAMKNALPTGQSRDAPRGRRWRGIRNTCLAALPLLAAACASYPRHADAPLAPDELRTLVTGHTVMVAAGPGKDLMIYLPPGQAGWIATVNAGMPPRPGEMSMVISWHIADASRLCIQATPLIGEMPSFIGPHHTCVQVLRSPASPSGFHGVVESDSMSSAGPLAVYGWDAFPPRAVERYLSQVRVLYGGTVPDWSAH